MPKAKMVYVIEYAENSGWLMVCASRKDAEILVEGLGREKDKVRISESELVKGN